LPKLVFKGTVYSGKGEGKKFVDLPWVKKQIVEKLGFSPYLGTLNLHLDKCSIEKKAQLENATGLEIKPQPRFCPGVMFKAQIDELECAVVIPKVPNYPSDVMEIIAPVCLRERLKLVDGNLVSVLVNV
jgi:riboflavin kinase, archaea type